MRTWFVVAILAVACSGSSSTSSSWGDKAGKAREVPPVVVSVAPVLKASVDDRLEASGTVEAASSAIIVPQTTGRVIEVRVKLGDAVRKGQLLAILRNEVADTTAQRTSEEVDHLARELSELESLYAHGAIAQSDVTTARFNLDQARSRLREAQVGTQQTRLEAPFDGVIGTMDLRVGELATATTNALQVVDPRELQVRARLPEQDLPRLKLGQVATLSSAFDDTQSAAATVTRIAPIVDSATGTFEVLLTLDKHQDVLRPGQYVRISLVVAHLEDVLTVPRAAIVWENGRSIVWTVQPAPAEAPKAETDAAPEASGGFFSRLFASAPEAPTPAEAAPARETGPKLVASRAPVSVGLTDNQNTEIQSGVAEGVQVVTAGYGSLREGARIRISSETVEPTAPAQGESAVQHEGSGG